MSYNRGNAPTYFRQNSNESTPSGLPIPPFDSNNRPSRNLPIGNSGSSRNGDGNGGGNLGNGRKNTVRGAVRGTIREQGSAGLPGSNFVPTRALTRGKTLTRPDRFVAPAPLINPNVVGKNQKGGAVSTKLVNGVPTLITREPFWDPWAFFVYAVTFWAPGWLLKSCTKLDDKAKQRAWKEKVALCMIIVVMGGSVAFLTIGLTRVLCPVTSVRGPATFTRLGTDGGFLGLNGWDFNITASTITSPNLQTLARQLSGQDISGLFDQSSQIPAACRGQTGRYATSNLCTTATSTNCAFGAPSPALFRQLGIANSTSQVGFDWDQAAKYKNFMVLDGIVLNMNSYMFANPNPIVGDAVDEAIRFILQKMVGTGGKDATRVFYNQPLLIGATGCLQERYRAGHIDKITPGCFASQLFLYFSLIIILAVVVTRLVMAFVFKWFLSGKLIREPKNLKRKVISPGVMPEGANVDVGNLTGAAPWTATPKIGRNGQLNSHNEKPSNVQSENGMISMASIGPELFCVCLVTCYSEGADGIRITLDSIAATDYSDARKLLFIVCDGIVTGGGEKETTPDIVIGMLEKDERFGEPIAMSYEAVAEGSKGNNMALVYAGHYTNVRGHRTPTIVVVKTGMEAEESEKKPGNRGKRDSQMILMNFFSRVTYNDRMSPLDYDLFRKIHSLMGVTPDFFEVCLMVDADTKVFPLSLTYMVRAMQNDNMIMGLCGETRIANKRQSWVTMIQVFEYFISHHMSKAFEAVFGGVTCLPGCFSLYRLKARKSNDGDWVPVLVSPSVISEYSQTSVTTLHQKNLLLLGEDRFLTTLLLRTFPNRKMMFVPQARCRTVVPDTFSVLLSQRRRWINSTVHNLMELVLVRDLCGTFCFSMQFVIFIDLVGTVVLPVAICLTYTLIINYIFNPPASFSDAIPLLLLGAVLGLPAILILMTTFKLVYVGWMLIYLIALPIWNFVLPVYAFIKFDDFSWGETRIVEGELKGSDHHSGTGGITAEVPLRRWEDWERSRLRKIKRDEKRLREMQKSFGSKGFHQNPSTIGDRDSTYQDSIADGSSFMSGLDEDRWGAHMGFYSEDGPTALPPPVGLYHVDEADSYEVEALGESEMNRVLSEGWNDELELPRSFSRGESSDGYRSRGNSYGPPILAPPMFYSHSNDSSQSNHSPKNPFSSSTSSFSDMNHSNSQQGFYAQESGSAVPLVNSEVSEDFPQNRRRSLGKTNLDTGSDLREIGGRTPSPTKERTNWNQ